MGSLKAEAAKIKLNLETALFRFGTVEVDPETDAALVTFRVNKGVPGTFDAKFRERTKKAGFAKVQFIVDKSLNEEEEDAAETAAPGTGATAAEPDWGGLNKTLGGLIGGIKSAAGSNADMLKTLSKLASDAAAAVTAKLDFMGASRLVEKLKEALGGGGAAPPRAPRRRCGGYGRVCQVAAGVAGDAQEAGERDREAQDRDHRDV